MNALCRRFVRALALGSVLLLLAACAALPSNEHRVASTAIAAPRDSPLAKIAANGAPTGLSGVRLLPFGASSLRARLALARRATSSIDAQYFILKADDAGHEFLRVLRDAADRGVRVRLLVDDLNTSGADELLSSFSAYDNVEVRLFNPFMTGRSSMATKILGSLADLERANRRMHNKMFVVDSAVAIVGGRNIANEYFSLERSDNFIDLDAVVAGEVVPKLAAAFDEYWNSPLAYPIGAIIRPAQDDGQAAQRERFDELTTSTGQDADDAPSTDPLDPPLERELAEGRLDFAWASMAIHVDSPLKAQPHPPPGSKPLARLRYDVTEKMRQANRQLIIVSPYFVPGTTGMELLQDAQRRQVTVKVLTNSLAATDEPLVHIGYMRYRPELLALGVELYEISPSEVRRERRLGGYGSHGRLHSKIAVIDQGTVFMGSMNFDPRSDLKNTEMCVEVNSPIVAADVARLVDYETDAWAYKVRLADGGTLSWRSSAGPDAYEVDPESKPWDRFLLRLLAPFVSEDLL